MKLAVSNLNESVELNRDEMKSVRGAWYFAYYFLGKIDHGTDSDTESDTNDSSSTSGSSSVPDAGTSEFFRFRRHS